MPSNSHKRSENDAKLSGSTARHRTSSPETPESQVEDLVKQIIRGINLGKYVPGQRLVEADLSKEYNVKRGPVRDALRVLWGDGIVELIPKKGARVRKLESADLVELIPILSGLVALGLKLAFEKLETPSIKKQLVTAMQRMRNAAALKDLPQFQLAGMQYQEIIQDAADNRFLKYLHEKLHGEIFSKQLATSLVIENWGTYLKQFEDFHEAIMNGQRTLAIQLIETQGARFVDLFDSGEIPATWR